MWVRLWGDQPSFQSAKPPSWLHREGFKHLKCPRFEVRQKWVWIWLWLAVWFWVHYLTSSRLGFFHCNIMTLIRWCCEDKTRRYVKIQRVTVIVSYIPVEKNVVCFFVAKIVGKLLNIQAAISKMWELGLKRLSDLVLWLSFTISWHNAIIYVKQDMFALIFSRCVPSRLGKFDMPPFEFTKLMKCKIILHLMI